MLGKQLACFHRGRACSLSHWYGQDPAGQTSLASRSRPLPGVIGSGSKGLTTWLYRSGVSPGKKLRTTPADTGEEAPAMPAGNSHALQVTAIVPCWLRQPRPHTGSPEVKVGRGGIVKAEAAACTRLILDKCADDFHH